MIALLLAAAVSAQAAQSAPVRAADLCTTPQQRAAGDGAATRPRNLTELPPGRVSLAVDKRVGGCAVTVLKQKDLAGNHVMVPAGPAAKRPVPASRRR